MNKHSLIKVLVAILLTVSAAAARADVLEHWTTNQITTNSFALSHVVYGNGIYVATAELADGGAIYTSPDGFNWTQRFSDLNSWGLTLNYSAGRFAGVGGFGTADVSPDGTNWSSSFLPVFDESAEAGQAITYGNGVYVTVGEANGTGTILTSPDGLAWVSRSSSPAAGGRIASVAYGPRKFVAVGNNDGLEYTSTGASAGTNWSRSSIPGGNKVSYANGLFFVPLNNATNLISSDGVNWSPHLTGLTNGLGVVTYNNSVYLAQCGLAVAGSYLATSTNGTNWVQYARPLPNLLTLYDLTDYDVSLATDGTRLVTIGETNSMDYKCNSFVYTSDVLIGVRMTNDPSRKIVLSGLVGRNYQIQSADALSGGATVWSTEAILPLPGTPYEWTDPAPNNVARFYRGVLLP